MSMINLKEILADAKCIIFYFYGTSQLNFDVIGLDYVPSVLEFERKEEAFKLTKTNVSYHGIPVYHLIRGYPRNIDFELVDDKRRQELMELKDEKQKQKIVMDILKEPNSMIKIIETLPSSFQVYSDIDNIYVNRAFNKQKFMLRHYIIAILLIIMSCIITWIICMTIYTAEISRLEKILIENGIEFMILKRWFYRFT